MNEDVAMTLHLSHDHVALRVVDYDAAIDGYTTKLDFTVDQEWPYGDMKLAYISNGTVKIEILGGSKAELQVPPTKPRRHIRHRALAPLLHRGR